MTAITDIIGREILDSRGNPTVEVDVVLADGSRGRAAVPSGASTGAHEAVELRDGDKKRYLGKGVQKAVAAVEGEIFDAIGGMEAEAQGKIDETMIALDGTPNKARLGANAILGVSLAVAKAAAIANKLPLYRYVGGTQARVLPVPMMNIVNGGVHADNPIDFQEFMIMPVGAPSFRRSAAHGRRDFPDAEEGAARRRPQHQRRRRRRLRAQPAIGRGGARLRHEGDRDGRLQARRGRRAGARSGLHRILQERRPMSMKARAKPAPRNSRRKYLAELVSRYPIASIEDGMAEDDFEGWKLVTDLIGDKCQLVGDDLMVTNVKRLTDCINKGIANSILVKVNQIGTLTETLAAVETAHKAGYTAVMSHRSGETEDSTIADLAVATNCGQIKTGSLARSDRTAKYNQLLRIEQELGAQAKYAGQGGAEGLSLASAALTRHFVHGGLKRHRHGDAERLAARD